MRSNIPRFLISRAAYNAMFFLPIWVVFVQDKHGLDLVQVTLLDSAFWLTMALTEVPTGAVADTIGRKQSYAIGTGLSLFGNLLFGLAPSYGLLLFANSLWALSVTFISGADMAFLYDTLSALDREAEYPRYRGIVAVIDVISAGLSGVLGSWVFTLLPEAPFILYPAVLAVALFVILTFQEPEREIDPKTGAPHSYRRILSEAARAIRNQPNLCFLLVYSNVLPLAGSIIAITLIQPYAVNVGVPAAALGLVLLGNNLANVAGSAASDRITSRIGRRQLFRLAPVLMAVGIAGLGLVPSLAGLGFYALATFSIAAARPIVEGRILSEVPKRVRATILSVDSLVYRLLFAAVSPLMGAVAEAYSLGAAFVGVGLAAGAVLVGTVYLWRRASDSGTD